MTSSTRLLFASVACIVSLVAGSAQGQARVLLLHDGPRAAELAEGLKVELAATDAEVTVAPSPVGDTALVRAGAAQRVAREGGAAFAIWVERRDADGELLRVVDPESDHIRDAPLPAPAATLDPRTFAAVAASLIGEHLDPAVTAAGTVRVRVRVETPGGDVEVDAVASPDGEESAVGLADPTAAPAPAPAPPVVVPVGDLAAGVELPAVPPAPDEGMPRSGLVLNLGLTTAFIATGVEVGLGLYLSETIRLDVFGLGVVHYIDDPAPAGTLGLDLTRVGSGHHGRFDFGGFAALLITSSQQSSSIVGPTRTSIGTPAFVPYLGIVAGAHIGWMWELSQHFGMGFRISGGASFVHDDDEWSPMPFGMLSLRTEIDP